MKAQPETLKIKVVRPFRVSGLDPATEGFNKETNVAGIGTVMTVKYSFGRQMINAGKAIETTESEVKVPPPPPEPSQLGPNKKVKV